MIRSKVNDTHDFLIEKIKDQFIVNGEKTDLDTVQLDDTNYHIISEQLFSLIINLLNCCDDIIHILTFTEQHILK